MAAHDSRDKIPADELKNLLNTAVLPTGVPNDQALAPSVRDSLKRAFVEHAEQQGCYPLRAWDEEDRECVGQMMFGLGEYYKGYQRLGLSSPASFDLPLTAIVLEERAGAMGRVLTLIEAQDRFFYIIPDERISDEAKKSPYFERFENPVLIVGERSVGGAKGFSYTPVFSEAAYQELLQHLNVVIGYLASSLKDHSTSASSVEFPCLLFSKMTKAIWTEILTRNRTKETIPALTDVTEIRQVSDGLYQVDVMVDYYIQSSEGEMVFSESVSETHLLMTGLSAPGFLSVTHRGVSGAGQVGEGPLAEAA